MCIEAFPSSEAFEAINAALSSSESERQDAVNQGKAIFAFKLKNDQDQEEAWHIDLKETGKVGKGEAPAGKKADGELILTNRTQAPDVVRDDCN